MPVFSCQKKISLLHTDATGVLFFPLQLFLTHQVLEDFLEIRGWPLKKIIQDRQFLMPVRHVTSEYFAPLQVGDLLDCAIEKIEFGTSSLTFHHTLKRGSQTVGLVTVVHVTIDPATGQKIALPTALQQVLQ